MWFEIEMTAEEAVKLAKEEGYYNPVPRCKDCYSEKGKWRLLPGHIAFACDSCGADKLTFVNLSLRGEEARKILERYQG